MESSKPNWRQRMEFLGEVIIVFLWLLAFLLFEFNWVMILIRVSEGRV